MKFPRSSVVIFMVVLVVLLSTERVVSLPIATMMIFLMQQPILTEEESGVVGTVIGLLIAVVYSLPLAVGIGLCLLVTLVSRLTLSKPHLQARESLLTLLFCGSLVILTHLPFTLKSVLGFLGYFILINVFTRIWVSRRSFHPRRLIK